MAKRRGTRKTVETITHDEAKRKNIPSAEHQSVLGPNHAEPRPVKYPRNTDLDPQLIWRGKDERGSHSKVDSAVHYAAEGTSVIPS